MTHREISREVNADFDDLKVRDPNKYEQREREYKLFKAKLGFDVATAPTMGKGTQKMEKTP